MLAMTTLSDSHQGDIITSGNYFLTQFRVVLTYLRLLVIPIGQNLDYDFSVSRHFWEVSTFLSFMCLSFLFFVAVKFMNKRS